MSAGWAWKCDGCVAVEIVEVNDMMGRTPRYPPVGWAIGERFESIDQVTGEFTSHRFHFCHICSDGRNL